MPASDADIGCLLCKTVVEDIENSFWGVQPKGGYFDLLYALFLLESECEAELCDIPEFYLTPVEESVQYSCGLEITTTGLECPIINIQ